MLNRLILITSLLSTILLLALLHQRLFSPNAPTFQTFFRPPAPDADVLAEDPHLNARLALAERLFQKSVDDRRPMAERMGYNRPFPDEFVNIYTVWDFVRPSFFCPHDLERVGSLGDGGKYVCGMSRYEHYYPPPSSPPSPERRSPPPETARDVREGKSGQEEEPRPLIVYSFGVEDDSRFEAAFLSRTNARVWGYDFSVDSWAPDISSDQQRSRTEFARVGIGGTTDLLGAPPVSSIQDLMRANNHTWVDLIKMDIEGAEFDALSSLVEFVKDEHSKAMVSAGAEGNGDDDDDKRNNKQKGASLPFGQLLVEIHFKKTTLPGMSVPRDLKTWLKWWAALEELGLRPVNNEENWVGDVVFGKPRFMEYTLINVADKERNALLW